MSESFPKRNLLIFDKGLGIVPVLLGNKGLGIAPVRGFH
jgi:hypothetical protein